MQDLWENTRFAITVDGGRIEVDSGLTILTALQKEGFDVPSLCNDVRLERANGSCGLCVVEVGDARREVKACITPVTPGMVIHTRSETIDAYRKVRVEQLLCDHNADCEPPCQQTCPAHIDIQRYLALVTDGNFEAAVRVIKDSNPFPSACGRVCPHTCEAQCRRTLVDAPVAINDVKRFAAEWDLGREHPWTPNVGAPTGKRIAIVGAGPSGLSAAFYAAIAGHEVTVFERQPKPGGMMRYGIPEYRLPKATLDAEIATITALGVRIVCGKSLGTHLRLQDLQEDFDAVYLAIGSWTPTPLGLEGENSDGVWTGIRYLEHVAKGDVPRPGKVVVVVGGGNTAIDCARTALRSGAERVVLLYRRTRDEMPAEPHEVADAEAEGVELRFLAAPTAIRRNSDGLTLRCLEMTLGEPDRSGRRRPIPVEGSDFELAASLIIGAIGQSTNTQFLYNDLPVRLNSWGDVEIDGATMETSEPKVFSGGDCVTGPATVIQAVAAGRGRRSHRPVPDTGLRPPRTADYQCSRGSLEDLPRWEFEKMPTIARVPTRGSRSSNGSDSTEVETGLTEEEARAEAARCLKCGCQARFDCDLRQEAAPTASASRAAPRASVGAGGAGPPVHRPRPQQVHLLWPMHRSLRGDRGSVNVLAYQFRQGTLTVGTHDGRPLIDTDCVSCGQCVTACPCGALDYIRERDIVFCMRCPTRRSWWSASSPRRLAV